jgi:hypothetical protein
MATTVLSRVSGFWFSPCFVMHCYTPYDSLDRFSIHVVSSTIYRRRRHGKPKIQDLFLRTARGASPGPAGSPRAASSHTASPVPASSHTASPVPASSHTASPVPASSRLSVPALAPGSTATMFHRCRRDSNDVPSWRLLLRAEGRIRVAGRAREAHGAYGKAVTGTGPDAGTVRRLGGWKRGVARNQFRNSLPSGQFLTAILRYRPRGGQVSYGWSGRVYSRRMLLPRREMSAP